VEMPDRIAADAARELVEATHQVCPYSNATRGNVPVKLLIE
jgi:lipoyl-dependent peroxiredoxin